MSKTIIVSNRLPVKITEKDGELILKSSAGGLATGLSSVLAGDNNIWIGWPGMEIPEEKHQMVRDQLAKQKLMPVFYQMKKQSNFMKVFLTKYCGRFFIICQPMRGMKPITGITM